MKRLGTVFCFAALGVAATAHAQDDPTDITLLLHSTFPGYSGCGDLAVAPDCAGIVGNAQFPGGPAPTFVWMIVGGVPVYSPGDGGSGGMGGLQFGIEYDAGVNVASFTLCTGGAEIPQTELGTWPESGTGNAITWGGGCLKTSDTADRTTPAGFFTVDPSEGEMRLIGDPRVDDQIQVTDCGAFPARICPQMLGSMNMGAGDPGFNPCGDTCAVPTHPSSWTGLKSLF